MLGATFEITKKHKCFFCKFEADFCALAAAAQQFGSPSLMDPLPPKAMDVGGEDTRANSARARSADVCADLASASMGCQSVNPGPKRLQICADAIAAFKSCKEEMLAAARARRGGGR